MFVERNVYPKCFVGNAIKVLQFQYRITLISSTEYEKAEVRAIADALCILDICYWFNVSRSQGSQRVFVYIMAYRPVSHPTQLI